MVSYDDLKYSNFEFNQMFYFQSSTSQETVINMEDALTTEAMNLQPSYEITKVLNPSPEERKFKQELFYRNNRLVLRTEPIPSEKFKVVENQYGTYVSLPVSSWLRQQFDTIEEYVTLNMIIHPVLADGWKARDEKDTPYKRIWDGDNVFIPLSNWCSYLRQDEDYLSEIKKNEMGEGTYEVAISVSGIFFGQHKDNKLASLTMRIQSILFKPKMDKIDIIIDDILREGGGALKHAKRKRKTKPY